MRQFEGGATRDSDTNKLDYEGFLHPLVLKRYAEYMHKHRIQADGQIRPSDNWQRGIPKKAYIKSLYRHFIDLLLHDKGFNAETTENLEDSVCAILFNSMGYLFETLIEKYQTNPFDVGHIYVDTKTGEIKP